MPVTVDHSPFDTASLGLHTIGDVLGYLQQQGRIAVSLTVDGDAPGSADLDAVRAYPADDRSVQIETADPRAMALDALAAMEAALGDADTLHQEAADLLQRNDIPAAMRSLSTCLGTWQQTQQCVTQSAALLAIDLNAFSVDGQPLTEIVNGFSDQLREIRSALENQDYVSLSDILTYELSDTGAAWRQAIVALSTEIATGAST